MCFGIDLFSQFDDWFKVNVGLFLLQIKVGNFCEMPKSHTMEIDQSKKIQSRHETTKTKTYSGCKGILVVCHDYKLCRNYKNKRENLKCSGSHAPEILTAKTVIVAVPTLANPTANAPAPSKSIMSVYTQRLFLGWLSLLCFLQALVHAHMIDVVAGKKECFFEDLHKQDKVRLVAVDTAYINRKFYVDDCYVSSRWWWTPRH